VRLYGHHPLLDADAFGASRLRKAAEKRAIPLGGADLDNFRVPDILLRGLDVAGVRDK
jgi:hypothetical protein